MCCFAQPVLSVTDTNLFARLTGKGSQLLAYQMKFSSEKPNAMILPIPVKTPAAEDSVRFISLKGYDDFFKDLDRGFPNLAPQSRSRDGLALKASNSIDQKLIVHNVGDFIASFVPSMDDFSRLDKQFVIPKESWDKIPGYSDFGFAVFQLKKLKGTTHPMAFEFNTRNKDEIFFPTVHIHDGQVHKREKFDHALYLQAEQLDDRAGRYVNRHVIDKTTGFVRSNKVAKHFCNIRKSKGLVLANQLVHRIEMKGTFENKDIVADLGGRQFKKFSLGSIFPTAPVFMGAAGLGWMIHRRNQLNQDA